MNERKRSERAKKGKTASGKPFDICERTFEFALQIVDFCLVLERKPGVSWALSKQLLRSGTSIGANVEEAQDGQSRPDFISKYSIARKEARETIYWLRLISESQVNKHLNATGLISEAKELHKIITSIIRNAKGI